MPPAPDPSTPAQLAPFCPACGGQRLQVLTSATVRYEVVLEAATHELRVVGEQWGESDWDASSGAECPACGWTGSLPLGFPD